MEGGIPKEGNIKKGVIKTKLWNPWGKGSQGEHGVPRGGGYVNRGKAKVESKGGHAGGSRGRESGTFSRGSQRGFWLHKMSEGGTGVYQWLMLRAPWTPCRYRLIGIFLKSLTFMLHV